MNNSMGVAQKEGGKDNAKDSPLVGSEHGAQITAPTLCFVTVLLFQNANVLCEQLAHSEERFGSVAWRIKL